MSSATATREPAPGGARRGGARTISKIVHHPVTRRLGHALLVAFGVLLVSFSILRLTPGDPAQTILGLQATPEALAALREELGLNGSLIQQFVDYVGPLLHGDLGVSLQNGQSVGDIIVKTAPVTLQLIAMTMILAFGISLALAVPVARHREGAPGLVFRVSTSVSLSIPVFFSGELLILLVAIRWQLLPVGGLRPVFSGQPPLPPVAGHHSLRAPGSDPAAGHAEFGRRHDG